jgi:hypothetical protein
MGLVSGVRGYRRLCLVFWKGKSTHEGQYGIHSVNTKYTKIQSDAGFFLPAQQ